MGIKNKLIDLNDHLFEQIERLNDDNLKGEELEQEIRRSKSITDVAKNIVDNAKLMLDAQKFANEYGCKGQDMPEMLQIKGSDNEKT